MRTRTEFRTDFLRIPVKVGILIERCALNACLSPYRTSTDDGLAHILDWGAALAARYGRREYTKNDQILKFPTSYLLG